MSETVSIKIRIDDSGTFKNVTVDAEDLNKAIKHVTKQANDFNKSLVNWSQAASASESLNSVISNLRNTFADLVSGFNDDQVGLAKLTQAMRNTMDASDEMVASVEELIDAQERLGVIEKDAQLAGAQELATYLQLEGSLKTLIPVMNDMAAQQIGIGASGESVAQIAAMLGKVMEGQTEALSRYGYKFDEAQKQILKFGTESERAAVLAEVVTSSVGGMNEALRDTDAGRMFEAKLVIDGIKDALGGVVVKLMPALDLLAQLGEASNGMFQLYGSCKAVWEAMDTLSVKSSMLAVHHKIQTAAQRLLAASGYTAAAGTTALKIATVALYGALTMGISLIIQGLIELFARLGNKASEAAGGMEEMDEATDAFKRTASEARSELAMQTVALQDLIKSKGNERDAVDELNRKYGEAFGYHSSAAEWYDILKAKSADYCRQLGYEAQAKVLASKKAEKELELEGIRRQKQSIKKYDDGFYLARGTDGKVSGWGVGEHYTKEYTDLVAQENKLFAETQALGKAFDDCIGKAADAGKALATSISGTASGSGGGSKVIDGLSKDIQDYVNSVERAVEVNQVFNSEKSDEEVKLDAMKSGITSLISKYGSESDAIQELIDEYNSLRYARMTALGMESSISDPLPKLELNGLPQGAVQGKETGKPQKTTTYETEIEVSGVDKIDAATESIGALSSIMQSLSGVVGEGAAAWIDWGVNLLNAIGQAIPAIATLIAARKTEATVNTEAAATGAAASQASIPYVGPILAVAAVASVLAAVANLPKFANGGIAYGPTLGLFGEYAGAGHNPEVVAPLDRLKSLIGGDGAFGDGEVEFRIEGRTLVGLYRKVNRLNRRT